MNKTPNVGFRKILNEILDWVKRLLQFKAKKITTIPYKIEQTYIGSTGVLKLVTRDTPRAIRTYIFTPFNIQKQDGPLYMNVVKNHYDIHLCLDDLGTIVDGKVPHKGVNKKQISKHTHCITILKTSRWMDKDGNFFSIPILSKEFDFLGSNTRVVRNKYAIPIFDEVAHLLKNTNDITKFDFNFEITFSQKRHMGAFYRREDELET